MTSIAAQIAPDIWRIRAANPSPMTGSGTNSWLLGQERLLVVDPGPDDPAHLAALITAIDGREVTGIITTHSHADHIALAPRLAQAVSAPLMAFGPVSASDAAAALGLSIEGFSGEGAGDALIPDIPLADGEVINGWQVLHTPGHLSDHICLWRKDGVLLTGDNVMGWSSSIIAPPAGDMAAYMDSLARLAALCPTLGLPGHGEVLLHPAERISELISHRLAREAAVLEALEPGPANCPEIVSRIYTELAPNLAIAAELTCLAHLIALAQRGMVTTHGGAWREAQFALS